MDVKELPELMTYEEVTGVLKVSKPTINRYTKLKVNPLPVIYLNPLAKKNPRIKKIDLKAWIDCLGNNL